MCSVLCKGTSFSVAKLKHFLVGIKHFLKQLGFKKVVNFKRFSKHTL